MSKWEPGQELTAQEALRALADGQKISKTLWISDIDFVYLGPNSKIICANGSTYSPYSWDGFQIYDPPKRKVKSERWFATIADQHVSDGVRWVGPYLTNGDAVRHWPDALAYVKAEVEVEVE